jgi:membrane protein implicated in regulation of membrane protease activity
MSWIRTFYSAYEQATAKQSLVLAAIGVFAVGTMFTAINLLDIRNVWLQGLVFLVLAIPLYAWWTRWVINGRGQR